MFHVEVINLDRCKDRWEAISRWKHGFSDFNRFSAIDAENYDYMNSDKVSLKTKLYVQGKIKRAYHEIDSPGAICCSLSHYTVLKNFYEDNKEKEYLIILEDDLDLTEYTSGNSYAEKLIQEFLKLPSSWDIWLLGQHEGVAGIGVGQDSVPWKEGASPKPKVSQRLAYPFSYDANLGSEYRDIKGFLGTHAILFKRDSIPKILNSFFPIECHYDCFLSFLAQKGDIRIIYKPDFSLNQSHDFDSSIAHQYLSVAILDQGDYFYKILFLAMLITFIAVIILCMLSVRIRYFFYCVVIGISRVFGFG